jgi:hypothetical protein
MSGNGWSCYVDAGPVDIGGTPMGRDGSNNSFKKYISTGLMI